MITKGQSIIGLQVILISNGHPIRTVTDILYDPDSSKVQAFVLNKKDKFAQSGLVFIEDLTSIGEDAIMIDSKEVLKDASKVQGGPGYVVDDKEYIHQYMVISEAGDEIGMISDIFFDTSTSEIHEFEVLLRQGNDTEIPKQRFTRNDILAVRGSAAILRDSAFL